MCDCEFIFPTREGWQAHYDSCASLLAPGDRRTRDERGTLLLQNPHLKDLATDHLYHLGLDTAGHDLPAMFGDVKVVCMGGTKYRMLEFAKYIGHHLGIGKDGDKLVNLIKHSKRYAMYKVGPVLSVSHGIGIPSMTVLLQEVLKLLHYSHARHAVVVRVGTSGGVGVAPGSVVVSAFGVNGRMERCWEVPILGKVRQFPASFDARLARELEACAHDVDFQVHVGGTMAADDFYRGQARTDGPFCDYSEEDKLAFLRRLSAEGVRNIEMEATAFAALAREAGVRAADVCVTLVDRLKGDQIRESKETMKEWEKRPMLIVSRLIEQIVKNQQNGA